ncbi:MAG TPA: hypothetical protein VH157_16645 [Bryobacteraceae bacterium]|jgi:hypothetical protein|nr:hypothetical protein [Bryobacteraceae bacterium]
MRLIIGLMVAAVTVATLSAQDAREIVRKSVELDQANWLRMKDYTWIAHESERNLDSRGAVKSEKTQAWETLVLYGEPHRRMIERDGKTLPPDEQRKEQAKLDRVAAKLANETPEQRQRRVTDYEKRREKEREFLREITDLYDFHLEGQQQVDGHAAWVISATPKPGYQPKRREAKPLLKIRGKIWIDTTEYQWVRLEAETTDTISYGLFIARLNPGAKMFFEQTRVNDEIWLPKRESVSGSGRLGLVKKIALQQELIWSNYRKFQVESKVVPTQ